MGNQSKKKKLSIIIAVLMLLQLLGEVATPYVNSYAVEATQPAAEGGENVAPAEEPAAEEVAPAPPEESTTVDKDADEITVGDFAYSKSKEAIIGYYGSATELTIPATLTLDGTVYPVKRVDDNVLSAGKITNKLTKVTVEEGVSVIGASAFAGNDISQLSLPSSITEIGDTAFAYNDLTELTIPASSKLVTIGNEAFRGNAIEALDFTSASSLNKIGNLAFAGNKIASLKLSDSLATIGDKAFEENKLSEVNLNSSLTSIGSGAFSKNGRYVYLKGDAPGGKSDVIPGSFGSIYKPISLWVKGIDKDSGKTIISTKLLENNPEEELPLNQLLFLNNEVSIKAPEVKGYLAENANLTLDAKTVAKYTEDNPYVFEFENNVGKDPIIDGLTPLELSVGDAVDLATLLKGVTATDSLGNDITSDIKVIPMTVDTSVVGQHQIQYSVTDGSGNTTTQMRTVVVGITALEIETGKGWQMKDFTYSGTYVTGFSSSGLEKLKENKEVVLPSFNPTSSDKTPITGVSSYAFNGKGLVSVTFPDTITKVESGAFGGNEIDSLNLNKVQRISDNAFSNNKLTELIVPESVTTIDSYAFYGNDLKKLSLPDNLTKIGNGAFSNNDLSSVALPAKLESIGDRAFENNNILHVAFNDKLKTIGSAAFKNNKFENLNIPETVTTIGSEAFRYNNIQSVDIPETVTSLGTYVFADNKLENVSIPDNMTKIPDGIFYNNRIEEFQIPNHVTEIGNDAFSKNWLKSLTVPANVTKIGSSAFANNYNLRTLNLNEGIVEIGDSAFYNCGLAINEFRTPSTLRRIGSNAFADGDPGHQIIQNLILNDGITSVGSGAFRSVYMDTVTIPSSLNVIESDTFKNNKLTSVTIPENITEIRTSAFQGNKLSEVNLPDSLTKIGSYAFYGNTYLKSITIPEGVKTIDASAFESNALESIDLPDGLESLGNRAFAYNKIPSITFPDAIKVVPAEVLLENRLTEINFAPGTTEISNSAFKNNLLPSVTLPDTLTKIGVEAFRKNNLTEIDIPDSVTTVQNYAFANNNLTNLNLSDNLTEIQEGAFLSNALSSVTIPDNVASIGRYAFKDNNISNLDFGGASKLANIGEQAFMSNDFSDITLPNTVGNVHRDTFLNNPGWSEKPGEVRILTDNTAVTTSPTHVVNEGVVIIHKKLNGTDEEIAFPEKKFGKIGSDITFTPKASAAYTPVVDLPVVEPVTKETKNIDVFYKNKAEFNNRGVAIDLRHAVNGRVDASSPYGLKPVSTNNLFEFLISITSSGNTERIENPWVEIDLNANYPGGHVNPNEVVWPQNIKELATEYKIEDGKIKIKLKNPITPNQAIEIPFKLRFDSYSTPQNYVLDLTGRTKLVQDGTALYSSSLDNDIGILHQTYKPEFRKDNKDSYIYGTMGKDGYLLPNGAIPVTYTYSSWNHYRYIDKVTITDKLPTYTGKDPVTGLERNDLVAEFDPALNPGWTLSADKKSVSTVVEGTEKTNTGAGTFPQKTLSLKFPGIKNKTIIKNTMTAEYLFDNREGVLNGSSLNEIRAKFKGEGTVYELEDPVIRTSDRDLPANLSPEYELTPPPEDTVAFDGSVYKRTIDFYGDTSYNLFPNRDKELVQAGIKSQNDRNNRRRPIYSYKGKTFDWYSPEFSYNGHWANAFRDVKEDRVQEFLWGVRMRVTRSNARDLKLYEYGLDERMKYTAIKLPEGVPSATVKFYDTKVDGPGDFNANLIHTEKIFSERFEIPEDISNRAKSFILELDTDIINGPKESKDLVAGIYTKLRNPDVPAFNPDGADTYGKSEKNRFYNSVRFTYTAFDENSTRNMDYRNTELVVVLPYENSAEFSKKVIDKRNSYGSNDKVKFGLDFTSSKQNGEVYENFKIVDVLPPKTTPSEVVLSEDFKKNAVNYKIEYIQNYIPETKVGAGDSQWAVVITADSYDPTPLTEATKHEALVKYKGQIATVEVVTNADIDSNEYVNNAYLSASKGGYFNTANPNSKNNLDPKTKEQYADYTNVLSSKASFHVLLGAELKGFKYVKSDTDTFWSSSHTKLKSEQDYEYKLLVSNRTSVDVPGFELIDVFPYNDDLRSVKNDDGVYNPRGTDVTGKTLEGEKLKDRVHLRGPLRFENGEEQNFKALYSTAPTSEYKGIALETISAKNIWLEEAEVTDWKAVTALKIVPTDTRGIQGNRTYNFYVPMKAPVNPDYIFDDKSAINSFAQRTGKKANFVEGNEVKVYMYSPRYTINIKKFGIDDAFIENGAATSKRSPLGGAKFKLWAEAIESHDEADEIMTLDKYKVLKEPVRGQLAQGDDPTFVTSGNGEVKIEELKGDRSYILEEVEAPEGYKTGKNVNGQFMDSKYIRVTKEQLLNNSNTDRILDVEVDNTKEYVMTPIKPVTGTVKLYKFSAKGQPLTYTGFEISGGPEGKYKYKAKAWASPSGLVEFTNLPAFGEGYPYTIKEISPRGTLQPIEPITVSIRNTPDSSNPVAINLGEIKNDKAQLNVAKLGIFNLSEKNKPIEKLKKSSGKGLKDVRLELQEEDGRVVSAINTNGRGEVTFKDLETDHDYYIAEPNTPEGYLPYKNASTRDRIKVKVDDKGLIWINDTISALDYMVFPNIPEKFTNIVDILKTTEDGHALPGAMFGLYEISETGEATLVEEKPTDDDGRVEFKDFGITQNGQSITLLEKTFEIRETLPPLGYVNKVKPVRFNTSSTNITYQNFAFSNPKVVIDVLKQDIDTKEPLKNAEFTLYEGTKGQGTPLEVITTDGEGKAVFTYSQFDMRKQYSIRETAAPAGYSISTNPVQVVDLPGLGNRDNFNGEATYTFVNRKQNGRLTINKSDSVTRMALSDVEFTLVDKTTGKDKEADRVMRTGSDGVARFTGLTIGKTYYLTETAAKPGYITDQYKDVPITISADGFVIKNLTNEHLPGSLSLMKVDEKNRKLENVEFTIERRLPGGSYVDAKKSTTNDQGAIEFNNLKVGSEYRIRETSVANATPTVTGGYKLSRDYWRVIVEHDENNPEVPKVTVFKNGSNTAVSSAPLTIVNERALVNKVKVNVEKTFNGGEHFDGLQGLKVALYRWDGVNEDTKEKVGDDVDLVVDQTSKALKMKASFTDLDEEFYDDTEAVYKKWKYYVEEVIPQDLQTIYTSEVTDNTADADSLTKEFSIVNTYTSPKIQNLEATKIWENGDAANRPTVWFKLYRKIASDKEYIAVEDADIKTLNNGITTVSWNNLDQTDADGYAYMYKVKEVTADGKDFTPANFSKAENGLEVTNSYVIPHTKTITAKKIWENGDPNSRPDVWFTLYRQVEGGDKEVVLKADGNKEIKKVPTSDQTEQTLVWTGLAETDINGKPYTYSVDETDEQGGELVLENYDKSISQDGLTITNSYVIPMDKDITATKTWINGPANKPDVWFKLYRQVGANGPKEPAEAAVKKVEVLDDGSFAATWSRLARTNIDGEEYIYTVEEVNSSGAAYTPVNYVKRESGLNVTNEFVSPKDVSFDATKEWVNGPAQKPTVWFKLYRQIGENGEKEEVPLAEAPLRELSGNTRVVRWTQLTRYNLQGEEYIYSVEEVDAEGNVFTPTDYVKTKVDKNKIKNTYVIPKKGEAAATKTWVNGDDENRPTVWFKLYRNIEGGNAEEVPLTEAPLVKLENGNTRASWSNLSQTDIDGNPYTFSVKEVDSNGANFTPENFRKEENGLSVTNTYVIPKDASATATKTWVNGDAANRPTVWFKLYRQVEGGAIEEVPLAEAPIKKLENGLSEVTWTNLSKTDSSAKPYTFTVKEVDEHGNSFVPTNYQKEESGLNVTNTYVIPKDASATATKTWVNGEARRMDIQFKLYRNIQGGALEEVPEDEAPIKTLALGESSVAWNNLSKTDINGKPYTFSVIELDEHGNEATFINDFRVSKNGLKITNTYVPPASLKINASKKWIDGSEDNRPDIWLRLYRNIEGGEVEEVPLTEAPIKKVEKITDAQGESKYSVEWTNITETDIQGNYYTFTVKEVDKEGNDFVPENYEKFENGLEVTNTYVSPKDAVAKGTKVWVNGPKVKPTVWFKLYRNIQGGKLEEVPEDEAPIKKLENGTTEVTWENLTRTDNLENIYTFSVKEVNADGEDFVPTNFDKEENGLSVINTYVIPKDASATAKKIWVDGDAANRPTVWFKLYRQIDGGQLEEVPEDEASIMKLENGMTEVTWTDLSRTDKDANPYTFSVKEVDEQGNDFVPEHFSKETVGLNVTNTYVIPKDATATATKTWINGDAANRPTVWFKLYRQVEGGEVEEVPEDEAPIMKLENGMTEVTWTELSRTDSAAKPYTFTVKEVDENGKDFVPENYEKQEDGLNVTNSYVIPKDASAIATKTWINGETRRTEIQFKLYRNIEGGEVEEVPLEEAPIKTLAVGESSVTWENISRTDINGMVYTFSVKEVDKEGKDFVPENYEKKEEGLNVTNTYIVPKTKKVTANKVWVGSTDNPTIWFKLYRYVEGGDVEEVPISEAPIKKLENGTTEVVWENLSETDITGKNYEFLVREVDENGEEYTPKGYKKEEKGLTVTNTKLPSKKAPKTGDDRDNLGYGVLFGIAILSIIATRKKRESNGKY